MSANQRISVFADSANFIMFYNTPHIVDTKTRIVFMKNLFVDRESKSFSVDFWGAAHLTII